MGKLFVTLFAIAPTPKTDSQWPSNPDMRSYMQFKSCTLTNFWLRDKWYPMTLPSVGQGTDASISIYNLRRDTAPVPATKFVTGDKLVAPIKLVPRSRQHAIKFVPCLLRLGYGG